MFLEQYIRYLRFLKNKGQGRYNSISEAVDVLNQASIRLFNEELTKYEQNQDNSNQIRHFKKRKVVSKTNGVFALPDNYAHFSGFAVLNDGIESSGDLLTDAEFVAKQNDVVCPATSDYPYARIIDGSLQVLPESLDKVVLYYIETPIEANAVVTISSNGKEEILDTSASTDLNWPKTSYPDLIGKSLAEMGFQMKDNYAIDYKQYTKENQQ